MLPIIILLLLIYSASAQYDADCITPTGSPSNCISLHDCDKLKPLIHKSAMERESLKSWHCGFDGDVPKVCCPPISRTPRCYTPMGTPGLCIAKEACPSIVKLLKPPISRENLDLIARSKCMGPSTLNVCCEEPVRKPINTISEDFKIQPLLQSDATLAPSFLPPNVMTAMAAPNLMITANPITIDDTKIPDVDNVIPLSINSASAFNSKCRFEGIPDPSSGCCGIDSSGDNRIFGGNATAIDQYPWLALIEYTNKRWLCGGSLISRKYVLTAAHCLVTNDLKKRDAVSVRLGDYNITNEGSDCVEVEGDGIDCNADPVSILIELTILHPEYKTEKTIVEANDIALVRLKESVIYSDFIRPICLPVSDILTPTPKNMTLYVAGWGAISETRLTSDVKFHVDLPFYEQTLCKKLYSIKGKPIIWDKQMCAGGEENKDSCQGDSGGPLMYAHEKTLELVGITSFGVKQCGNKGRPSIYTKVHSYMDWIRSEIKP